MKVAVVAGTPVDTRMGVDYLKGKSGEIETVSLHMFSCPQKTSLFQMSDHDNKVAVTLARFLPLVETGIRDFFVYCNSLCATVDYDAVAASLGVRIITVKNAYGALAKLYDHVGVIAANNQTTKWIEDTFIAANPGGYVCGTGFLKLVEGVESGVVPAELVNRFCLDGLCRTYEAAGCQAVILGCTHFPYFQKELQALTALPVLNPADILYEELMG